MAFVALTAGALAGLALLEPAALQTQVEAFSGRAALVDPRLLLPACPRPDLAWGAGGRSVTVHCGAPEWRVYVPVGEARVGGAIEQTAVPTERPATAGMAPAIRRGDRVSLEMGGAGFVIAMDSVAEADSRDGRVAVRPTAGGRRLYGVIEADGRVRLAGLRSMVNGR